MATTLTDVLRLEASETGLYFNLRAKQTGYATDTKMMVHKFSDGSIAKYASEEYLGSYGAITGIQGPQGVRGDLGPTGIQGYTGIQGVTGLPGTGSGATGPQGLTGLAGEQGYLGMQGVTGSQGATGAIGATGIQGPQGYQGSYGQPGTTGINGIQGSTGAQGSTGVQGFQGAQGIQGATGPQGAQGSVGTQGPQGYQGIQGAIGLQGNQGVTGPQGYYGWQGVRGFQGPQGATGLRSDVTAAYCGIYDSDDTLMVSGVTVGTYYPWHVNAMGSANAYIVYDSSSCDWICTVAGYYFITYSMRIHTNYSWFSQVASRIRVTPYGLTPRYICTVTQRTRYDLDYDGVIYTSSKIQYLGPNDRLLLQVGDTNDSNATEIYSHGLAMNVIPARMF